MKHYYVVTTEKIKTALEHPSEYVDNLDNPLFCWSLDDFTHAEDAEQFKKSHPEKNHLKVLEVEKF